MATNIDGQAADMSSGASVGSPTVAKNTGKKHFFPSSLAVRVVEGLLVIVLGFFAFQLFLTLFFPVDRPNAVPAIPAAEAARPDISIFAEADPFGTSGQPLQVVAPVAEETSLNLRLVGTFVDPRRPSAIIQGSNGDQEIFFPGDDISPGVTLQDVYAEQVILARGAITETLSLVGREGPSGPSAGGLSARPMRQATAARPALDVPQEMLAQLATSLVTMEPHPSGEGVILTPGNSRSLFDDAGFRSGDHLVAINGAPVTSEPDRVLQSLATGMQSGEAIATVRRDGAPVTLRLNTAGLLE